MKSVRDLENKYHSFLNDDTGNYGRGGYYGNTYRQESFDTRGQQYNQESYRRLGDRRHPAKPQRAWDIEYRSREGYRSLSERLEAEAQRADHTGKGPRSYHRSDSRILEDLNDHLWDDEYIDASEIETHVENGEVTLTGSVGDRRSKRRAEDLAYSMRGVTNVLNLLRVTR
mgnify:FL=1|jgi:osmotically-inducible protein OsmY